MENKFYIERTNKDGSFEVIAKFTDCEAAIKALAKIDSELFHGVWCDNWPDTYFGFAPIAWIN